MRSLVEKPISLLFKRNLVMKKACLLFLGLVSMLYGCKAMYLSQEAQTATTQPLVLGSTGSGKDFILQKEFKNSSYPSYKAPIKLTVSRTKFTKSSYKSFLKAKTAQSTKVDITYVDSLENKPYYVKFTIVDKVTLINTLNNRTNNDVKNYLELHPYANIITNVSIAFNKQDLKQLEQAKSVFLKEVSLKTYALQYYTQDDDIQTMPFDKGVVFAYKTSNCCWEGQRKRGPVIVDVVSEFNNCPNGTFRSAHKADRKEARKNKVNYFKL